MDDQPYRKKIETILNLITKTGYALVATADQKGTPHMAAAGKMERNRDGTLEISEWFCPGTLTNIRQNPRISLVIWDHDSDDGYQLIGKTRKIEDSAILDGYSQAGEAAHAVPQVERKLTIEVASILHFSRAPHNDLEE